MKTICQKCKGIGAVNSGPSHKWATCKACGGTGYQKGKAKK